MLKPAKVDSLCILVSQSQLLQNCSLKSRQPVPLTVTFKLFLYKDDCAGNVLDLAIFAFLVWGYFLSTVLKEVISPLMLTMVTSFLVWSSGLSLVLFLFLLCFSTDFELFVSMEWRPGIDEMYHIFKIICFSTWIIFRGLHLWQVTTTLL